MNTDKSKFEDENKPEKVPFDDAFFESDFFRSVLKLYIEDMVREFEAMPTSGVEVSKELVDKTEAMITSCHPSHSATVTKE